MTRTFVGGFDYDLAGVYAVLGQKEKAYRYLRSFDQSGWPWGSVYLIRHDPLFDSLREDAEFKKMVQQALREKEKQRREIQNLEEL
jgi:hypothetical protein